MSPTELSRALRTTANPASRAQIDRWSWLFKNGLMEIGSRASRNGNCHVKRALEIVTGRRPDKNNYCEILKMVRLERVKESVTKVISPEPITIDPHYRPQFYAELWGVGESTVIRWFQDMEGVLRLSKAAKNGKRGRMELRIPFSLAMRVYREHTRRGVE